MSSYAQGTLHGSTRRKRFGRRTTREERESFVELRENFERRAREKGFHLALKIVILGNFIHIFFSLLLNVACRSRRNFPANGSLHFKANKKELMQMECDSL